MLKKLLVLLVYLVFLGPGLASASLPSCSGLTQSGEFGEWYWLADKDGYSLGQSKRPAGKLSFKEFKKIKGKFVFFKLEVSVHKVYPEDELTIKYGRLLDRDYLEKHRLRIEVDGRFVIEKDIDSGHHTSFKGSDFDKLVQALIKGQKVSFYLVTDKNISRYKEDFSLRSISTALQVAKAVYSGIKDVNCFDDTDYGGFTGL